MNLETRSDYRIRRHKRLRRKISGTAARPRMSIYISNKHIEVQFVNDDTGATVASATTRGKEPVKLNIATAAALGVKAAANATAKGISLIVVDRGGYKYHGRVRALVEAVLTNGLKVNDEPYVVPVKEIKKKAEPAKPAAEAKSAKKEKPAGEKSAKEKPAKEAK
jgi:large subunit ribosomal protein L18